MSRDYKERPSPNNKKGNPMLVGIFIGLFAGLALSLAVALVVSSRSGAFVSKNKPPLTSDAPNVIKGANDKMPMPQEGKAPQLTEIKPAENKPQFDFYTILPGATEESVSDQEIDAATQKPDAEENKDKDTKETYFLQAGSFQTESDADDLKAKLALMGVEAAIQTATIPEKGIWHRVRVGPYAKLEDVNRVRATLNKNGVPTNVIKIKSKDDKPAT